MKCRTVFTSGALLCACLALASMVRADQIYVGLQGAQNFDVATEMPDTPRHFEARELSLLTSVPYDMASGSLRGARQYPPIKVTKAAGAVSLMLYQSMITNETLADVIIDFVRPGQGGAPQVYQSIRLSGAKVVGFERKTATDARNQKLPVDEISFSFRRVEFKNLDSGMTVIDDLDARR